MADRESRLLAIATALADGTGVDWNAAESSAGDEAERDQIRRLRSIHDITQQQADSMSPVGVSGGMHDSLLHPADASESGTADPIPVAWGPLRVIEKIGRGRFGDVYRAWDPRLDREVALKLLRHRESDREGVAVIEEGRLLAKVRHPNVVTVFGAERIDERVGVWMERVRGRTLEEDLAANGPLSPEEAAAVGIDVCRALAAVHRAGLVHRDVKAQNVMRDEDGRVVLMDFGTGRDIEMASRLELAGTPLYLAPELFDAAPATPRSDLYSAGVLVYHLATGSFPVRGRTLQEMRETHARRAAGARPLIEQFDHGPSRLVAILERALAHKPDDRFVSASEMAEALGAVVPARRNLVRPRRRRAFALALLGLAILVAGAAGSMIWNARTSAGTSDLLTPRLVCENCGDQSSSVDREGRSISQIAQDGQRVRLRTLANGTVTDWPVRPAATAAGFAALATFSPDATRLAYLWLSQNGIELRVIPSQSDRTSRVLFADARRSAWPLAWSPDGRSILAALDGADRTSALVWIDAVSGEQTILKALQWRAVRGRPSVSPDGRFVAYSALPVNPEKPPPPLNRGSPLPPPIREQRIYIRAADGSGEVELLTTAAVHDAPLWSSDGRQLLFISNQSGTFDLWAMPIDDGRPAAPPLVLRRNLGNVTPIALTSSGTYFYTQSHPAVMELSIASLPEAPAAARMPRSIVGERATWSPDGRFIALIRRRPPAADAIDVVVHELETGQERVYSHDGVNNAPPLWFGDSKGLLVGSAAADGQHWSRIDLETREIRKLARNRGDPKILTHWGIKALVPGGETLVIAAYGEADREAGTLTRIMALEFAAEKYRQVLPLPGDPAGLPPAASHLAVAVSPDGGAIAVLATDPRTDLARLARVNLDGTGYRELCAPFRVPPTIREQLVWTENGILTVIDAPGDEPISRVVRVPAEGGVPELTGLTVPIGTTLSANPDGSRILSWRTSRTARTELWSLDLSAVLMLRR